MGFIGFKSNTQALITLAVEETELLQIKSNSL